MNENINKPLVAIGIPVYNGEKFIAEALESIIRQTYPYWECHIINNASTDSTEEIVRRYADHDSRIILHRYESFYPIVDNWNRVALHIPENALYFKLLQADDWIEETFLEEMVAVMEKHPSVGICSSYRIDGKVVNCDGLDYYQGQFHNGPEMLMKHFDEEIDITGSISTLLFRVSSLQKLPKFPDIFDPADFHCDTQLAFDMMSISDVGFVFKVLSYTRWHPEAYTSSTCVVYNTFLNGREIRLNKFKNLNPSINKLYLHHRYHYAYFLIKKRLRADSKCLRWHNERISRKFTTLEYLKALWYFNPLNYRLFRLIKKLKPTS
jgi:glycosyltransferase involved in cell wall biosynthesis